MRKIQEENTQNYLTRFLAENSHEVVDVVGYVGNPINALNLVRRLSLGQQHFYFFFKIYKSEYLDL